MTSDSDDREAKHGPKRESRLWHQLDICLPLDRLQVRQNGCGKAREHVDENAVRFVNTSTEYIHTFIDHETNVLTLLHRNTCSVELASWHRVSTDERESIPLFARHVARPGILTSLHAHVTKSSWRSILSRSLCITHPRLFPAPCTYIRDGTQNWTAVLAVHAPSKMRIFWRRIPLLGKIALIKGWA